MELDKQTNQFFCECGNNSFKQVFELFFKSSIVSETGQNEVILLPKFQCTDCKRNSGNDELLKVVLDTAKGLTPLKPS
jgi:hypothetical protein